VAGPQPGFAGRPGGAGLVPPVHRADRRGGRRRGDDRRGAPGDGLLGERVDPRFGTDQLRDGTGRDRHQLAQRDPPRLRDPYRSILLTGGLIVAFIAALGRDIAALGRDIARYSEVASVLYLIVYALMNVALIVFREADVPE